MGLYTDLEVLSDYLTQNSYSPYELGLDLRSK